MNDSPSSTASARHPHGAGRWRLLAALLGVTCLLLMLVSALLAPTKGSVASSRVIVEVPSTTSAPVSPVAPAGPIRRPGTSAPVSPVAPAVPIRRPVVATAQPVRLSIASIGVDTDLVRLRMNSDQTVQVPADADRAGWFSQGTKPGDPGSSVILGHVDSMSGPAVFYRLRELAPGERIVVTRADGSHVSFRVRAVATYANEDFPARKVYAGSQRRATLNLVTCGGVYDPDNGGYQSNVVVFTHAVRGPTR